MVTKRTKKERLSRRFSKLIKSIGLLSEKGFNNYPIGSGGTVWLSEKNSLREPKNSSSSPEIFEIVGHNK